MARSKDLFDESTMSFGEHLEVLRTHLWKALIGVAICTTFTLFFGDRVLAIVRKPIDDALAKYGIAEERIIDDTKSFGMWDRVGMFFMGKTPGQTITPEELAKQAEREALKEKIADERAVLLEFDAVDLRKQLGLPPGEPMPPATESPGAAAGEQKAGTIQLVVRSDSFRQLDKVVQRMNEPITLTVQEAFMTYLKVSIVAGLVLSSPWVFFQLWQFVAAGLYQHERSYVYYYLPLSLTLFLGGVVFCFYIVFPFVLNFLLSFNMLIDAQPQIRLSEWISFAIMLPLMFGLSFQLPMVMLFLERISIFNAADYRAKRRMAILVISIVAMLLTPPDPTSMIAMLIPLVALYELGIILCGFSPAKKPFEGTEAA